MITVGDRFVAMRNGAELDWVGVELCKGDTLVVGRVVGTRAYLNNERTGHRDACVNLYRFEGESPDFVPTEAQPTVTVGGLPPYLEITFGTKSAVDHHGIWRLARSLFTEDHAAKIERLSEAADRPEAERQAHRDRVTNVMIERSGDMWAGCQARAARLLGGRES